MQNKVVGEPCQYCGTPYVMGNKGAYCKPCYIKYKNGQQQQPVNASQARANNLMAKETKAVEEKKWEDISRGKVRHGFAIEAFKAGMPLDQTTIKNIDRWVEYVMTGKLFTFAPTEEVPVIEQELPVDFPAF